MAGGKLEAGFQVPLVGVHATGAEQAAEVQFGVVVLDVRDGLEQRWILEEGAVVDGGADACELLQDTLARANIEMADLGVTHLPFWQPYRRARGCHLRMRPLARDGVEMRLLGE